MKEPKFRHEMKYPISSAQMAVLQARLFGVVPLDPHVGPAGKYTISSLYFDDYNNRCFYENENGVDPREKFRIRIYNHSLARISLELKRKERSKTQKTSALLREEDARLLMMQQPLSAFASQSPLINKFSLEQSLHRLRPTVIVEYERYPYIYDAGNVRITFDTQISSSADSMHFLDGRYALRPVMPAGLHLLEVKYDEYLPDFIYHLLLLDSLQQTAYSKYYLCRKYSL